MASGLPRRAAMSVEGADIATEIAERARAEIEQPEDLGNLDAGGIGDVDDVLVTEQKAAGVEVAARITQAEAVDGGDGARTAELWGIGLDGANNGRVLVAEDEDARRIGALVEEPAGERHGFENIDLRGGKHVGARLVNRTEDRIALGVVVDVDAVAGEDEDVLALDGVRHRPWG